jgi:predicted RNase H-like nuclease (RuvC/YqgF family)
VSQPVPYGYGQGYGYGAPGYNHRYNHVRALQARVDHLQREISRLAQYRMINRNEFHRLQNDARQIERRLRREVRDGRGLNPREVHRVERQIAQLEYRIARDVRDGRRWAHRW